jgi:hypothetical protein
MNENFENKFFAIFFALLIIVLSGVIMYLTVIADNKPDNKPDIHCIDNYVYYYSPRNNMYVATSNPPKICIKENKS